MSPCNCSKSKSGAAIVHVYIPPTGETRTFASMTEAEIERTKNGGKGRIVRTTQPAR